MKTKLLSLLLVLLSFSSFSQTTAIPDLNFEKFLINEGIDSGTPDGVVLTSNINTLTSLSPSGLNIASLVGIQDFVALTSLNCSFNSITTLDVSKNVTLTRLNCFTNKLTSLNVSNNVNLTSLSCSENKITSLDVSKNLLLTSLDCYTNLLPSIDVSNNTTLTSLNCNFNPFTTLDVSKNTALTFLNCNFNQLKTLDVSQNVFLTSLNCNGNTLTSLDISKNTVLTFLDCTANKLTSLNLKNGNNTKFSASSSFKSNPDLTCIVVDSDVYADANWASKKDATASYAMDCTVQQYTLIPDVNFEKKLIALGIDSGATDGKVLTSKINTLTFLHVSSRSISDLTGIQDFVALADLDCSQNNLTDLDVSKNLNLKYFDCSFNKLSSLDITKNEKLIQLHCLKNQLNRLDVSRNFTLELLSCSYNNLTSLNISQNFKLHILDCKFNQISSLDVSKNKELFDFLYCNNNKLTSLNIKNGVKTSSINFTNNPELYCIVVDNVLYSYLNWSSYKDSFAIYSDVPCGLPITLPSDNFTIETKAEFCVGQNNGEINITAKTTKTYVAIVNGKVYNFIGNSIKISDLAPSVFEVSVFVKGEVFEQKFTITIAKASVTTGRSTFNSNKVAVEITEGTAPYAVFVNGTPQFETVAKDFEVTAKKGDLVEVKTAKACEGVFSNQEDGDALDLLSGYPNPTSGKFEITLATAKKEVAIEIFHLDSQLISNGTYTIANGKVQLNLENQPAGLYMVKVNSDQPAYLKIIKK
jgi:Leucine-rich repeat (LRR) protein